MDADYEDVPVSSTDHLTNDGGEAADRTRFFGDYKPTNAPLSKAEAEHRKELGGKSHDGKVGWTPRTTENISEITPIEEHEILAH
jgi:hypothetical protein